MKKFKSISFMEKGYGHFPYLIIRIRAGLYQQIPIHRTGIENELLEGLFINCKEIIDTNHYKLSCKEVLERYWQEQKDKGTPKDVCLVLNSQEAHYLSKKGERNIGVIPSGGWLYSLNDELIQEEGEHYLYKL
jgi:hypothetical protein